jgi:ubiquinone/menaquinone biosynthesis C-methylase UbiE
MSLPVSARVQLFKSMARTLTRYSRLRLSGRRRTRQGVLDLYQGPEAEWSLGAYRDNSIDIYRRNGRLVLASYRDILEAKAADIARYMAVCKPRTVLEIGANCAVNTAAVSRLLPETRFVAMDISQRACRAASTHFRGPVVCGDALKLPFRSQSFDLVYTHSALYTLEDQLDIALAEVRRLTRRWFMFVEPFFESLSTFERMYCWHKGFMKPVLPRIEAMGLKIRTYEILQDSHHPYLNYWIALGEVAPR